MAEGWIGSKLQCENPSSISKKSKGSPSLPKAVLTIKPKLAADLMLDFMDGPRHTSNEPTLRYGAFGNLRNDTYLLMDRNFHSIVGATYGTMPPNPGFPVAQLSVHEGREGRVIIPGYYDGIRIHKLWKGKYFAAVPDDEAAINKRPWIWQNRVKLGRPIKRVYSITPL